MQKNRNKLFILILILISVSFNSIILGETRIKTSQELKAQALKWYEKLPAKKYIKNIKETDPKTGFVLVDSRLMTFEYKKDGFIIQLNFQPGMFHPPVDLESFKAYLTSASLSSIPVIQSPGWSITLKTPFSSFHEGIKFLSYKNKIIKMVISGTFFAIYGIQTGRKYLKDRGLPPGSYFEIRKSIPFAITLEVPFSIKTQEN